LVRRLAERHGGSVQARSEGKDRGAEFVVTLPLAGKGRSKDARLTPEAARRVGPRRVLVVEDHVDSAEALAILLRMEEHDVRTAYDSAAALGICETFLPDLVLLDIGLPGMDGYDLGRLLREKLGESVVIVALTGFGQDEDRRRSKEAGIDEHVLKPIRSEAIDHLMSARRSRKDQ
jgi:CheY-like chemotaxis protein